MLAVRWNTGEHRLGKIPVWIDEAESMTSLQVLGDQGKQKVRLP